MQILEQPISTPRIAKSVESILELCSEATAMRMSVMLTWPLLIAGLYCLPENREKVSSLFDAFQYDYCEDLRVAVSNELGGADLSVRYWRNSGGQSTQAPTDKAGGRGGT
jgi:hypothetical protein